MATEYKFMFDRRFDEDEPPAPFEEDLSKKSVDGIPSISQLLDTLNETLNAEKTKAPSPVETEGNNPVPPDPATEDTDTPLQTVETEQNDASGKEPAEIGEDIPEEVKTPETPEESSAVADMPASSVPPYSLSPSDVPVFSESQLKAAEEKAREEGRVSGLDEGREAAWQEAMVSLEKQNSDTLTSIDASLKNIIETLEQNAQDAYSAAVDFALAVCKKAIPALCATNAIEEIRSLLKNNLHFLKDEPKISLCLTPFLADQIKPVLADMIKKESYGGKISIVRDDSLAPGDCRVEWKNGGLEKNVQDVLNHTEELIKLYNHTVPTDQPSGNHNGEEHHG